MTRCTCGHEAVQRLYVHFRYPRAEWLPEAVDPYYVRGGAGYIETCGNPECEADAFLACRQQIIDTHQPLPPLSAEQVAGLELEVGTAAGFGFRVAGDGSAA